MGMADPFAGMSEPQGGKRVGFVRATKTPPLYQIEGDAKNYYVRLTQAEGMATPGAQLAQVEGEKKASFFKLAGVKIAG